MTKFTRRQAQHKQQQFAESVAHRLHLSQMPLQMILFAVIIFAALSYLFYINQTATGGFDIKGIEQRITQLEKDNKKLEVRVAELQSLTNIERASTDLNFVAISQVDYLPVVGTTVAQR